MSEEKKEYLDDLKIEGDALDLEWLKQSGLYMKWAEKSAEAEDKVKLCKEALEVIDAKIDKIIREDKTIDKVTEGLIKSRTSLDEKHIKALQEYNDALYYSNLYSGAVKAMDHRKSALENLVKLALGSYFSMPKDPLDINRDYGRKDKANVKARDEAREKSSKKIGAKKE